MTRQEAIEYIHEWLKDKYALNGKDRVVLNMAIEALTNVQNMHKGKWIPVSVRLPDKDGEYLVCPSDDVLEDYSDFSDVMIMPYDEGCEAFGWWTDRFDNISLGYIDSDFNKFDVIAWQPLPDPYKGGDTE